MPSVDSDDISSAIKEITGIRTFRADPKDPPYNADAICLFGRDNCDPMDSGSAFNIGNIKLLPSNNKKAELVSSACLAFAWCLSAVLLLVIVVHMARHIDWGSQPHAQGQKHKGIDGEMQVQLPDTGGLQRVRTVLDKVTPRTPRTPKKPRTPRRKSTDVLLKEEDGRSSSDSGQEGYGFRVEEEPGEMEDVEMRMAAAEWEAGLGREEFGTSATAGPMGNWGMESDAMEMQRVRGS